MTVKELIALLMRERPNAEVLIQDKSGEYFSPEDFNTEYNIASSSAYVVLTINKK
jgi:hypothetical protein